jgi:hypothetical protein
MFAAKQIAGRNLGTYQSGNVHCEKCQSPIQIRQPTMVSVEFCVRCKKCDHRGIYYKRMIYIEDATERRAKPRK